MSAVPLLVAAALLAADPYPQEPARPDPAVDEGPAQPLPPLDEAPARPLPPLDVAPERRSPAFAPAASAPVYADRPHGVAAGAGMMWLDGIPTVLATFRAGVTGLPPPRDDGRTRIGVGWAGEMTGGETENGLSVGGLVMGPQVVAVADRLRGSLGVEVGLYGIKRATNGDDRYLLSGFFRGALEADLWRGEFSTLFLSATGTVGGSNDIPFRGVAGLLGLRM